MTRPCASFPSPTRGLSTSLAPEAGASRRGVQPEPCTTGSGSRAWWKVSGARCPAGRFLEMRDFEGDCVNARNGVTFSWRN